MSELEKSKSKPRKFALIAVVLLLLAIPAAVQYFVLNSRDNGDHAPLEITRISSILRAPGKILAVCPGENGSAFAAENGIFHSSGATVSEKLPHLPEDPVATAGGDGRFFFAGASGKIHAVSATAPEKAALFAELPAGETPAAAEYFAGKLYVLTRNGVLVRFAPVPGGTAKPELCAEFPLPERDGKTDLRLSARDDALLVIGVDGKSAFCWREKPKDATVRKGVLPMAAPPADAVRGAGPGHNAFFGGGQAHLLMLAGNRIFAYHTVTDSWAETPYTGETLDFSGAAAMPGEDGVIFVFPDGRAYAGKLFTARKTLRFLDYWVIGLYLLTLILIGAYFAKKEKTADDFFLGGRKVPWWAVGVSIYATGTSAFSFMAIPAKSFDTSILYNTEAYIGVIGQITAALLVIPVIRRINITSVYEYLEMRFGLPLRIWGSSVCILFQIGGRMSVALLLPSLAISAVTGVPVIPCILIMGLLATVYTYMGGISAVIWTDVLQTGVLFGGAIICFLVLVLGTDGGFSGWSQTAYAYGKFHMLDVRWDFTTPVIWIWILNTAMTTGAAAGDQVMIQRVLATSSVKEARKSYLLMPFIVLPGSLLFTMLGVALFTYFRSHPQLMSPAMANIDSLPLFIVNSLPPGMVGLVLAGLFAAAMSTLDSSMNSVSTLAVTDFYTRFYRKATPQGALKLGKNLTLLIGLFGTLVAVLMATFEIKSIFDMWTQLFALFGGGFGGVYILGMFTRRGNLTGALTGAVTSVFTALILKNFTPLHFSLYLSLSILSCAVVGYVVSLLTGSNHKALENLTVWDMKKKEAVEG